MSLHNAITAAFVAGALLWLCLLTSIGLMSYAYRLWQRHDGMWLIPACGSALTVIMAAVCIIVPLTS